MIVEKKEALGVEVSGVPGVPGVPVTFRTSETELRLFRQLAESRYTSLFAIVAAKARQAQQVRPERQPEQIDGSGLYVDTNFSMRISPEIKETIANVAQSQGIGKTELVHQWLWEELERDGIAVLTKPTPRSQQVKMKVKKSGGKGPKAKSRLAVNPDKAPIKHRKIARMI